VANVFRPGDRPRHRQRHRDHHRDGRDLRRPQTARAGRRTEARRLGDWSRGINGAIVAMGVPKGKEQLGKTIAEGEGFFAKLAQKAAGLAFDKAIDVYFGDGPGQEVDAGAMRRVATDTPGFIVMAADKDEGTRILSQGLEKALIDAANDTSSVLAHEDRPWILLRPKAVALALTRVFTFGRRSLS
jgi:hypothetical protein